MFCAVYWSIDSITFCYTNCQANAESVRRKETAVRSRSGIAGAYTTVAPEIAAVRDGVHSPLTTPGTNCGVTAGEDEDVSILYILGSIIYLFFGNFSYCILVH